MIEGLEKEMLGLRDPDKARLLSGFFKTGRGEYGEGDVFFGIMVPVQRKLAKKYKDLSFDGLQRLLSSRVHEHRFVALVILMGKYEVSGDAGKGEIFRFYLKNTNRINNWDLVDVSSPRIVGDYLLGRDRSVLYELAKSSDLWERRIAIISTSRFIREGQFGDTFRISEILMGDSQDLIHKAVGWMLREVGKRDEAAEEQFLKMHCRTMPRTMLRYAIERFSEDKRRRYLSGRA